MLAFLFLLLLSCYVKYINIKIDNLQEKTHTYCKAYADAQNVGEPITVTQCDAPFSYGLQYPQTGQEKIDERIVQIVNDIRSAFNDKYLHSDGCLSADTTLLLSYETYTFSDSHISLIFYETHIINNVFSPTKVYAYHFDIRQNEEQLADDLMYKNFRECASRYAQKYFQETVPYKNALLKNYNESLLPEKGLFDCFALTFEGVLFFINPNIILPDSYGVIRLLVPYEEIQPSISNYDDEPKNSQKIDPKKPMVALTFDDGPNPVYTNLILDVLEEYDVSASFFDLGFLVESYPYVSRREAALGCEVGSHSYDHKNLSELSDDQIEQDVMDTSRVFCKVLGQEPSLFRPPYGNRDQRIANLIPMPLILWSVDTLDWKSRNANTVMELVKDAGNLDGKVILMHSIHESSAEATKMLVPYLLEENYQLVTVSQMIELRHGDTPQNNRIYGYDYFQ